MTPSTQDARATGLVELAVRCGQAAGADDNLAMEIIRLDYDAPGGIGLGVNYDPDLWMERNGIDPTASLDAAMSLIGTDAFWRLGNDGEGPDVSTFKATVTSGDGATLAFHDAVAATPALALTAAALRALAASTKDMNHDG